MKRMLFVLMAMIAATAAVTSLSSAGDQQVASSRAYSGHENDGDANNFVAAYPATAGTRLDDCRTCHRVGVAGTDTERVYNACGYCHLLPFPNKKYGSGAPLDFGGTLNAYGRAYKSAGRTRAALLSIAKQDTDGDGYPNAEEIAGLRYPGDPKSKPEQPLAHYVTLSWDDIAKLPVHEQFLLMNTSKQQYDEYVLYSGVKMKDVLEAAGIDLAGATGITVYAPDGFGQDFSLEEVFNEYPRGVFHHSPKFGDADKGFVSHPLPLPEGLTDRSEIPDPLWLMIACQRNGKDLDDVSYQSQTGRLRGEGPFRLIAPQKVSGRPDRGLESNTYHDGWDFDASIDHNAGECVRGMCVIRINPMPAGYEEYDWGHGWSLIEQKHTIIYGHGVAGK